LKPWRFAAGAIFIGYIIDIGPKAISNVEFPISKSVQYWTLGVRNSTFACKRWIEDRQSTRHSKAIMIDSAGLGFPVV
jgi:hypothetical protein